MTNFLTVLKKVGGYAIGIGIISLIIYSMLSYKAGASHKSAYGDDAEYYRTDPIVTGTDTIYSKDSVYVVTKKIDTSYAKRN